MKLALLRNPFLTLLIIASAGCGETTPRMATRLNSLESTVVDYRIGSTWNPYQWNAAAPTSLRNSSSSDITIDSIRPRAEGLEIDGVFLVRPQTRTIKAQFGEGWPPEYGHGLGETSWTLSPNELFPAAGQVIPGAESQTDQDIHGSENERTVMFKVRLREGEQAGRVAGFAVSYHDDRDRRGILTIDLPFYMCVPDLLEAHCREA